MILTNNKSNKTITDIIISTIIITNNKSNEIKTNRIIVQIFFFVY